MIKLKPWYMPSLLKNEQSSKKISPQPQMIIISQEKPTFHLQKIHT